MYSFVQSGQSVGCGIILRASASASAGVRANGDADASAVSCMV